MSTGRLKGHLKGALNNGASIEEVRAVREVVVRLCELSGMSRLGEDVASGWGWYVSYLCCCCPFYGC